MATGPPSPGAGWFSVGIVPVPWFPSLPASCALEADVGLGTPRLGAQGGGPDTQKDPPWKATLGAQG